MIESLHEVSEGLPVDVVCMDAEARRLLEASKLDGVRAIDIAELEGYDPDLALARPGRTLAEYCWTAKATLCRFLLERNPEAEVIVYADADLMFFHDPRTLLTEIRGGSALVVPHRAPSGEDWERLHGTYNAGFVAFSRSPETFAILEWWRDRCLEWCFDRVEPGRFCDQKYLDEWPRKFPGVRVLRHAGGGVAPWNVSGHRLSKEGELVRVDGSAPLVFFHFQSLCVYRGLVGRLARLGVLSGRFHPVPTCDSIAWSVWASYAVSDDAERHVYRPYVARLAAAACRLAELGQSRDGTYRRLGASDLVLELGRGILGPIRRAVLSIRTRKSREAQGPRIVRDEPPAEGL